MKQAAAPQSYLIRSNGIGYPLKKACGLQKPALNPSLKPQLKTPEQKNTLNQITELINGAKPKTHFIFNETKINTTINNKNAQPHNSLSKSKKPPAPLLRQKMYKIKIKRAVTQRSTFPPLSSRHTPPKGKAKQTKQTEQQTSPTHPQKNVTSLMESEKRRNTPPKDLRQKQRARIELETTEKEEISMFEQINEALQAQEYKEQQASLFKQQYPASYYEAVRKITLGEEKEQEKEATRFVVVCREVSHSFAEIKGKITPFQPDLENSWINKDEDLAIYSFTDAQKADSCRCLLATRTDCKIEERVVQLNESDINPNATHFAFMHAIDLSIQDIQAATPQSIPIRTLRKSDKNGAITISFFSKKGLNAFIALQRIEGHEIHTSYLTDGNIYKLWLGNIPRNAKANLIERELAHHAPKDTFKFNFVIDPDTNLHKYCGFCTFTTPEAMLSIKAANLAVSGKYLKVEFTHNKNHLNNNVVE